MSPYRVLIQRNGVSRILMAQLNASTMTVSIVEKQQSVEGLDDAEVRRASHQISGSRNSRLLQRYLLERIWSGNRCEYRIRKVHFYSKSSGQMITTPTNMQELTQYDCLKCCMEKYCKDSNLEIVKYL